MKKQNLTKTMNPYLKFLIDNSVPIIITILVIFAIPLSGLPYGIRRELAQSPRRVKCNKLRKDPNR